VSISSLVAVQHKKKREKLSNLLIDIVKYLSTVIGIGAIIPDSQITLGRAALALAIGLITLIIALLITPED
jgi:hypothetical protein